jgi:hypothetical protein
MIADAGSFKRIRDGQDGMSGRTVKPQISSVESTEVSEHLPMADPPPFMPTGIKIGMLTDDETKVGVLIIETDEGDFDFALNLEAVETLAEALELISTELRGETRQ